MLLCLVSAKIFSQIDTIYYDDNWRGVENPMFAEYYRVLYTSTNKNYANKFKDYWMSGELQAEGEFINIDKYDDKNSVFAGICKSYYKGGKIEGIRAFVNGLEEGEGKLFYENGNLQMIITMKQSIPNGICKTYYEDGKIKTSSNFEDGKVTGLFEEFHPNGKIAKSIQYHNGTANGLKKFFDEEGNHVRSVTMVNDTANGKAREIYSNGNFAEYMIYNDSIDYSKVDLFDSAEKHIISYNVADNWSQIAPIIPTIADIKTRKMKDDVKTKDGRIQAYYELNGLCVGAVIKCEYYPLLTIENKVYEVNVFFENLGLASMNVYFSDIKIEFIKKTKNTIARLYSPQSIYEAYAQQLQRKLNIAYSNAQTTAHNAATISSSGSEKTFSSSSVGAVYSRGTIFGNASLYGRQTSNYSGRTVDGLLRYQIEKEETGKVDDIKIQYENQLNNFADALYYNFTLNPEEPQWRALYTDFKKADILRVTLTINNIPYVFEWNVSHIKKK